MRDLMRDVVLHGTGTKADVPGYKVGGKTGTAEKLVGGHYVQNARISSFVGAFPDRRAALRRACHARRAEGQPLDR